MFATCKIHVLTCYTRVGESLFWRIQIYIVYAILNFRDIYYNQLCLKQNTSPQTKNYEYIVLLHEKVSRRAVMTYYFCSNR